MANPTITALPEAPQRRMAREVYPVVADKWAAALGPWTTQVNDVVTWMGQQIDAAAASKKAAADSATAAGQSVTDAAAQVKLASDQAVASKGSADAAKVYRDSAQVSAQAAQAAAGLPPNNNPGWYLRQKLDGSGGVEWVQLVVSQVGDTIVSSQAPDSSWVPTGRIYNQSTYPTLFARLGAVADWLPSQQLQGTIAGGYSFADMVYANGLFVAPDSNGNGVVMTSADGVAWTQRSMPSASSWSAIEYGTNFVAVATGTTYAAATSPDGITWTARSLPSQSSWTNVKYNSGTYLAVVSGSQNAATSTDGGANWTARTLPNNSNGGLYGLAAGAGIFVSLLGNSSTYYTSANGISWTSRVLPLIPVGVIYANNMFLAWNTVGVCATSADGINWQTYSLPAPSNSFIINGGGGLFVIKVAGSVTYYTATASELTKWTARTTPWAENSLSKMVYANRAFVSLDAGGNSTRRLRRPWSYDPTVQFYTTDPQVQSQGLLQYIKAA